MKGRDRFGLRLTVPEALVSIGLVAWGVSEVVALPTPTPVGWRIAFVLMATVPLAWRNRWPGIVMAWTLGILLVQEVFDPLSGLGVTPYQCVCLATYALAASERRSRVGGVVALVLVIVFPSFLYLMDTDGSYQPVNAIGTAIIQLTIVIAGSMVRTRRIEARRADALLQEEARSGPARLEAAVTEERETIAGELQALIASDLAEIERLLAQASSALDDADGVRAAGLAETVQATAARAVAEMRQLLLALGHEPGSAGAAADLGRASATSAADGAGPPARPDRTPWLRDRAADVAVMTPLIVLLAAEVDKLDRHQAAAVAAGFVALLLPALARRRWPLAAASVIAVGMVLRELVGLLPPLPVSLMPMLIVAAYASGAFASSRRRASVGASVTAAGGLTLVLLQLDEGGAWPDVPVALFVVGCAFAAGELVRDTGGRLLTLRAGTARLAAEHRRRRAAALEDERRRAARELHDVVAHGVSLIAVQAGAAAVLGSRDPAAASRAISHAHDAARQTRDDLALLADALGVGAQAAPPGAPDLRTLVASAQQSGQQVALRGDAVLDALPPDVGVSVYRVVQEALTNARKHASPQARTTIDLGVAGGVLSVDVRTAAVAPVAAGVRAARPPAPQPEGRARALAPAPGSGRGIAGMRERARLLGGELDAGSTADGGFAVAVRLPVVGPGA